MLHRRGVVAEVVLSEGLKTIRLRSTVEVRNVLSVAVLVQFEGKNGVKLPEVVVQPGAAVWAPLEVRTAC